MHPWSLYTVTVVTRPTVTPCSPAVREVGPQYGRRQAAAGPHSPGWNTLTLPWLSASEVLASWWLSLGNSSNIDNCCYHCRPPAGLAGLPSATNNQPTNWVKADTETIRQSRSRSDDCEETHMQICTPNQPARCQQGQMHRAKERQKWSNFSKHPRQGWEGNFC